MRDTAGVVGGWLVVAGALGVVLITGIYASASPNAGAPLPANVPMATALAATVAASGRLWLAGTIGIVADILLIGGAMVLALREAEPVFKRLFWLSMALSTAIFIAVDGLASQVIPRLVASGGDNLELFAVVRAVFDAAFVIGVLTFGAGFIAAFAARGSFSPALRYVSLAGGVLSIGAFGLHVFGVTSPLLLGVCVGLAGILGAVFGYRETRAEK